MRLVSSRICSGPFPAGCRDASCSAVSSFVSGLAGAVAGEADLHGCVGRVDVGISNEHRYVVLIGVGHDGHGRLGVLRGHDDPIHAAVDYVARLLELHGRVAVRGMRNLRPTVILSEPLEGAREVLLPRVGDRLGAGVQEDRPAQTLACVLRQHNDLECDRRDCSDV